MSIRRERSLGLETAGSLAKGLMLMSGGASASQAAEILELHGASAVAVREIKAAVAGHLTTDDALGEFREATQSFLAAVAHHGLFDRGFPFMAQGALHTRHGVITAIATAYSSTEGFSRPIARMSSTTKALAEMQAMAIVVMTKEALRLLTAAEQISQALALGVGRATDDIFVAHCLSVGTAVAALGVDARGVYVDIKRALAALTTSAGSEIILGMSPALAKRLSALPTTAGERAFPGMTPNGGEISGLPCVATDALGADVVMYDATAYVAAADAVAMDRADHATLEMATDPTSRVGSGSPSTPVEQTQVSLFQTNSTGIMCRRTFGFEPMRAGVVKLTNAGTVWGYDTTTSPPL